MNVRASISPPSILKPSRPICMEKKPSIPESLIWLTKRSRTSQSSRTPCTDCCVSSDSPYRSSSCWYRNRPMKAQFVKLLTARRTVARLYVTTNRRRLSNNHHRNRHRSNHHCDDNRVRGLTQMSCTAESVAVYMVSSAVYRVGSVVHKDDAECVVKRAVERRVSTTKSGQPKNPQIG